MPATLGHIGIQVLLSKGLISRSDTKWALLGCIIPDIPWIAQRLVHAFWEVPAVPLRIYFIAQSSLAISLALCLALSMFSRSPWLVFRILSFGALLHLLLDSLEIKWGNGVVLFAPAVWNTWRADLFWPEDVWPLLLFGLGALTAVILVFRTTTDKKDVQLPKKGRLVLMLVGLLLYVLLPWIAMPWVKANNLHYVGTIADTQARAGKPIEIDRNSVVLENGQVVLETWFGESILLEKSGLAEPGQVSVKGTFTDPRVIEVSTVRVHDPTTRVYATQIGLLFILLWWFRAFYLHIRT
jgi:hypothetical protein